MDHWLSSEYIFSIVAKMEKRILACLRVILHVQDVKFAFYLCDAEKKDLLCKEVYGDDVCRYCRLVKELGLGGECLRSTRNYLVDGTNEKSPTVNRCNNGLIDMVIPLEFHGKVYGYLVYGCVRSDYKANDGKSLTSILDRCSSVQKKSQLKNAYEEVPFVAQGKLIEAEKMLAAFARMLSYMIGEEYTKHKMKLGKKSLKSKVKKIRKLFPKYARSIHDFFVELGQKNDIAQNMSCSQILFIVEDDVQIDKLKHSIYSIYSNIPDKGVFATSIKLAKYNTVLLQDEYGEQYHDCGILWKDDMQGDRLEDYLKSRVFSYKKTLLLLYSKVRLGRGRSMYLVGLFSDTKRLSQNKWLMAAIATEIAVYCRYALYNSERLDFKQYCERTSHQLMAPAQGLIGYADPLIKGVYNHDEEILRKKIQYMRAMANTLEKICQKMDWVYIKDLTLSGKMNIQRKFLREFILDQILNLKESAKSLRKRIILDERYLPVREICYSDQYHSQVFFNVLRNAIKYSYKETCIYVKCFEMENSRMCFQVISYGLPILPEERTLIFEEKQRGRFATLKNENGTGLGLFLSRKIMESMGGELTLLSSEPGSLYDCWNRRLPRESSENIFEICMPDINDE